MSLFASIVKTGFADIDESVNSTLAEVRQKDKVVRLYKFQKDLN